LRTWLSERTPPIETPQLMEPNEIVILSNGLSKLGSDGHKIWALFKIVVLFHNEHRCDETDGTAETRSLFQ
jgi:hypothetical protein